MSGSHPPRNVTISETTTINYQSSKQNIENEISTSLKNQLQCQNCQQVITEPVLLSCYHILCNRCLRGRNDKDGKVCCSVCGRNSNCKPDHVLRYLMEVTNESRCANCDRNEKSPMFYCNTCGQTLCSSCRDETHKAKMFALHDIIHISHKMKDVTSKKCSIHGDTFLLFCTLRRSLFCFKCVREIPVEERTHCIDIDSAYSQARKRLDRALLNTRELQTSLRDGVVLFRKLIDELTQNLDIRRKEIETFYSILIDNIKDVKETVLKELESQYQSKDKELYEQLSSLGNIVPSIQMLLLLCTTFTSTASKQEFLKIVYELIERFKRFTQISFPLKPESNSELEMDFKEIFFHCLQSGRKSMSDSSSNTILNPRRLKSHHSKDNNLSLTNEKCHEQTMRELNKRFGCIKDELCELHTDLSNGRCLSSQQRINNIVDESTTLKYELEQVEANINNRKVSWEQENAMILSELSQYKEQMNDLISLRQGLLNVMSVTAQFEPYLQSMMNSESSNEYKSQLIGGNESLQPPSMELLSKFEQSSEFHQPNCQLQKCHEERIRQLVEQIQVLQRTESSAEKEFRSSQISKKFKNEEQPMRDVKTWKASQRASVTYSLDNNQSYVDEQETNEEKDKKNIFVSLLNKVRATEFKNTDSETFSALSSDNKSCIEPPGIGKPCRVLPLSDKGENERERVLESNSVSVYSVIRFNKKEEGEDESTGIDKQSYLSKHSNLQIDKEKYLPFKSRVIEDIESGDEEEEEDGEEDDEDEDEENSQNELFGGSSTSLPSRVQGRASEVLENEEGGFYSSRSLDRRHIISSHRSQYTSSDDSVSPPTKLILRRSNNNSQNKFLSQVTVHRGKHEQSLSKADSFEGHEEAVRNLVEAVHESRQKDKNKNGDK